MSIVCCQIQQTPRRQQWLDGLWNARRSPRPLAWFRIGLAGVLLVQAFGLLGHLDDLYGRHGVVDWSVNSNAQSAWIPSVAWLDRLLTLLGAPPTFCVPLAFAAYVGGLLCLLTGYRSRPAAMLVWLTHTALMSTSAMASYGVDQFAHIGLFYCVWFPVGHALSWDQAAGRVTAAPTFAAWLALRVLQVHVCIIYTAAGVEKALGEQWWNGEAIWRAVMGAPFDSPLDCTFLATVPWLARVACWMTLLLEASVLAFVWHPKLRRLWLVGIVGMHLGIGVMLGLWTFSATMIVFDIAAFGIPSRSRCDRSAAVLTDFHGNVFLPPFASPLVGKNHAPVPAGGV
jgi:hypothetical protein